MSYPGSGTVDGMRGDHLLYAPPLSLSRDEADELVEILDASLSAVAGEIGELGG